MFRLAAPVFAAVRRALPSSAAMGVRVGSQRPPLHCGALLLAAALGGTSSLAATAAAATPAAAAAALPPPPHDAAAVEELWRRVHAGDAPGVAQLLGGALRSASLAGVRGTDGWTPLLLAAMHGHTAVAALLLQHGGADVHARLDDGEDTALVLAAAHGHAETVVLLAAQGGADVDARRASNRATALIVAAALGHERTVEALTVLGADLEARDSAGETALDHAARQGQKHVMALLLQRGAPLEAGNDLGGMRWGNVGQGKDVREDVADAMRQ